MHTESIQGSLPKVRLSPLYQRLTHSVLKPIMLIFWLCIFLISGMEYTLYMQDAAFRMEKLKANVRERLLAIGKTASLLLDGRKHSVIFDPGDTAVPEFKELTSILRKIRDINGISEEIYTLRLEDPKNRVAKFVVMTNKEPYIGTSYIYPPEMDKTFHLGLVATTDIYKSRSLEGLSWMSVFVPVREPGAEECAVLEVDISVENLLKENAQVSQKLIFFHALRGLILLLIFVAIYFLVTVVLKFSLTELVDKPLAKIIYFIGRVKEGVLKSDLNIKSGDELEVLADSFNNMVAGLKEKDFMSRFLTGMEMQEIKDLSEDKKELSYAGDKKITSILFSDIRSFTTICENSSPETIIAALNYYFDQLIPIIQANGGHLDKLIGDCIMAVFEESEGVNSASNAVQAAIQMQQALKKMRPEMLARGWPEFFSGTGINTGDSVIGNVGAKNQLSRTVLGDSVNLAARVESLSKEGHESHILFTEFTLANLTENNQSPFQYKFLMETKVKGKSSPVKIYEIDQSHLEV